MSATLSALSVDEIIARLVDGSKFHESANSPVNNHARMKMGSRNVALPPMPHLLTPSVPHRKFAAAPWPSNPRQQADFSGREWNERQNRDISTSLNRAL